MAAAAAAVVGAVVGVSTTGVLVVVSGATYTSEVLLLVVVGAGGATYTEEELGVSTGAMATGVELEELEVFSRKSPGVGLVVTVASVVAGVLALSVG